MSAYPKGYLQDVVENQGKLFELVAENYPDCDTEDFIKTYMAGKTRKAIDDGQAYVATMGAKDLFAYYTGTENYTTKKGKVLQGFFPDWAGEFYAYYQWFYNIPSREVVDIVPLDFLKKLTPAFMIWILPWPYKKWVQGTDRQPRPVQPRLHCGQARPTMRTLPRNGARKP